MFLNRLYSHIMPFFSLLMIGTLLDAIITVEQQGLIEKQTKVNPGLTFKQFIIFFILIRILRNIFDKDTVFYLVNIMLSNCICNFTNAWKKKGLLIKEKKDVTAQDLPLLS